VTDYRKTLAERCVPIGGAINPEVACVTPMMVHHDEREAILRGLEGGNFFGYSLGHFYIFGDHKPGRTDVWSEFQKRRAERGFSPDVAIAMRQRRLAARLDDSAGSQQGIRGAVGTPEQLREYLRRYEEAGVDQMIFVMQAGMNKHEHIMEAIELFAREVLPEFAERDEEVRRKKRDLLAPLIEAAMKRKPERAQQVPDDYTIPALAKPFVEAYGGNELVEKLAGDSAIGIPRPRDLQEQLITRRK